MKIDVIASTKVRDEAIQDEYNLFGGRLAGICYMPHDFETLKNEPINKTKDRANGTKSSGHHSVFEHAYITFYMEGIPKLFAMLLNNEKVYTTSEKSARYTNMKLEGIEEELYNKWLNKFIELISNKYGNVEYFDAKRIKKLAMENARYFTSVLTPTNMSYTVSYRQLNYICGWMQKFSEESNEIYKMLIPTANEFLSIIESFGYLDKDLMNDGKGRDFSLLAKRARELQFGECYSVNYKGSWAMLAQAQRHRTLHYEMMLDENPEYFIPLILKEQPQLVEEWILDMKKVEQLHPQGELLNINERGDYENLILKAQERLCTAAQLEVMQNTKQTIEQIIKNTDNDFVKQDLEKFNKGSRCLSGFECIKPCAFKEGITCERII